MPVRFAVTKVSGQGEQLVVDICQWNPVTGGIVHSDLSEMQRLLDDSLAFCDARLQDMNLRMLEAYELEEHFDPGTWQKIIQILDILAGRQSAAQVVQRWRDTAEENAALQRGREEAAAQGQGLHLVSSVDIDSFDDVDDDSVCDNCGMNGNRHVVGCVVAVAEAYDVVDNHDTSV